MMLWNSAISVNDLEAITTIARHIGLCRTSNTFNLFSDSLAPSKDQCEWISSFSEDPDLALEAVYLKLRFQLRNLGRHSGMTGNCKNTRQLLKRLKKNQTLNEEEYFILLALVKLIQKAINGAHVERAAAEWAATTAPKLLNGLDAHLVPPDLSQFGC